VPTVGYQGEPGAFSDDAARALVPGAETIGYGTFDDAFAALANGLIDRAVLPVENSISGQVPRVYDLLWDEPRVTIVGELVYRVVQQLVGCADVAPSTLTEIRSHAVALEQCRRYLATVSARPTIVADTAGAIRDVVAAGDPHVAAIGSALAAKRYGGRQLHALLPARARRAARRGDDARVRCATPAERPGIAARRARRFRARVARFADARCPAVAREAIHVPVLV